MKSYRSIIICDIPEYTKNSEGKDVITYDRKYLPIDLLDDRDVTSNSVICSQPLLNGDTISDHMYRDPVTLRLSGKFSLNGRNISNKTYQNLSNYSNDRLASIQEVFEFIKNNGLLCTITTIECDVDRADPDEMDTSSKSTRFITRHNMALQNITWGESVNTLKFSFSFKEIIAVNIDTIEGVEIDLDYPMTFEPRAASIGTVLNDTGQLAQTITEILNQHGYFEESWKNWLQSAGKHLDVFAYASMGALIGIGASLGIALLGAILPGTASIIPVGTIVAAAIGVIAGVVVGIKKLFNWRENKAKAKKIFKMINGSGEEDLERLIELLDKIGIAINNNCKGLLVYDFSFGENEDDTKVNNQYCISVGDEYYYISIISTNEQPFFKAQVFTSSNGGDNLPSNRLKHDWCVCTSMSECDNSHVWFTDSTGEYKVFLMNPSLDSSINETLEEKLNVMTHLSGYTIWVCKGSMKEQSDIINDTLLKYLEDDGFNVK